MKGLGELVLGCIASGLLSAAAFFAVDALVPAPAEASVYGFRITSSYSADKSVRITSSYSADKSVRVAGKCSGSGYSLPSIRLTDSYSADESWRVTSSYSADMSICLSGDIDEWFEHAN